MQNDGGDDTVIEKRKPGRPKGSKKPDLKIVDSTQPAQATGMEPLRRMSRDIRKAAETISDQEARFLVNQYYAFQEERIRAAHRIRKMDETGQPNSVLQWLEDNSSMLEVQIKGALDVYSGSNPIGSWMREIKGIGPVIAAGFLANVDITRSNTAGKLWALCGQAPGRDRRVRGEKVTYSPALKRLTYLVGESFKRLGSGDEDAFYRHIYDQRKAYEVAKNEAGDYADQAKMALEKKRYGAETDARKHYMAGHLPPAHIDRRACRYAAKIFLAHLHEVWWEHATGTPAPTPFALGPLKHANKIVAPHVDRFLADRRAGSVEPALKCEPW